MLIRDADLSDVPRIARLYDLARASLHALGIDQWQNGYPDAGAALEDIERGVARVVTVDGKIIATAAVYVGHEPTYDRIYSGAWLTQPPVYGLIHRIAVAPEARRLGAATAIMDYCAALTRAAGAATLRCDTHAGNTPMRRTLERNGYAFRGVILLADGSPRAAYERII